MNSNRHVSFVAAHLSPFHIGDERLGVMLAFSVGRLMLRKARNGGIGEHDFPGEKIQSIANWLEAAILNDSDWIRDVDHLGRPKKLLEYPDFEALLAEVEHAKVNGEWHDWIEAHHIPDCMSIGGYLELGDTEVTALPDRLTVTGNVDLSGFVLHPSQKF